MFRPRQLLSATLALLTAAAGLQPHRAAAQAAAGSDVVVMAPAAANQPPRTLQGVLITGMQGNRMMVRDASGEVGYDVRQVQSVTKAAPPEFTNAQRAVEAGNFEAALPLAKAVADRFKGLPTAWAQEATSMVGNLYVSLGKLQEAEVAFTDFERLYGAANSAGAKIGKARLAAAKGRIEDARTIASDIVTGAMAKKNVSRAESQLYGQAYFVLGQCAEKENKLPEAMEHYCRTVAIFYQDPTIVKEAQKRIDDLRTKKVTTP
jgi:tetratricopeptide (TPR) repeat protein